MGSLSNYRQGNFEKIKPNNRVVQEILKLELDGDIINAYNLYDVDDDTVGILCTKIIKTEELAGCEVLFIPLGEDGYYAFQDKEIVCNLVFNCKENGDWVYSKDNKESKYMRHLSTEETEIGYKLLKIQGNKASPRVVEKVSKIIKSYYKRVLGIDKAYNDINF